MGAREPTSTQQLTYVIIPLIALFVIGSAGLFFYVRRRRRRQTTSADGSIWGQGRGRWVMRNGVLVYVPRQYRRSPWGGLQSQEGLNELGEAPPPYKTKPSFRREGDGAPAAAAAGLRDMEEGRRPPEYVAEPAAAVVADSRRTGV